MANLEYSDSFWFFSLTLIQNSGLVLLFSEPEWNEAVLLPCFRMTALMVSLRLYLSYLGIHFTDNNIAASSALPIK